MAAIILQWQLSSCDRAYGPHGINIYFLALYRNFADPYLRMKAFCDLITKVNVIVLNIVIVIVN